MKFNHILVTGAAGFIGYHMCLKLIEEGFFVIGIDNLNDYYDVILKKDRLKKFRTSVQRINMHGNLLKAIYKIKNY